ncbi:hypothetical protein [Alkanindiges illinoisensis]|uniref:Uncharacterized protein n=1 Tax=Alkanindiges illinoisensis TaxID=197183 RepID=A0A4Y7XC79_9GAMM|nr:hypothetical protein [Alkanindiges illinoisensis]TEU26883.1 hypothetical protein E2B99_07705 [Alkanindiges illinoisensis]
MPDPAHLQTPDSDPVAQNSLHTALAQQQQYDKRLNKISIVIAIILALIVNVMAANQNLYSLLATFMVTGVFLILASVYQRSLLLLLPLVLVFCLTDNLLSHQLQLDYAHLFLQLGAMGSFTALFRLSRPYLIKMMQKF